MGPITPLGLVHGITGFQGFQVGYFLDSKQVFRTDFRGYKDLKSYKGFWPDFKEFRSGFRDFRTDIRISGRTQRFPGQIRGNPPRILRISGILRRIVTT